MRKSHLLTMYPRRFAPSDVPGLRLWLAADFGAFQDSSFASPVTADAQDLAGWRDRSGSGNHATQATAAKKPRWRSAGAIYTALPVADFAGTDDLLETALSAPTRGLTIMAAVRLSSGGDQRGTIINHAGVNSYNTFWLGADSTPTKTYAWKGGASVSGATTLTGGVLHIIACTITSADLITLYLNGVADGSGTIAGSASWTATVGGDGYLPLAGYIGEIALYNREAAASELRQLHRYFGTRWGVAVP